MNTKRWAIVRTWVHPGTLIFGYPPKVTVTHYRWKWVAQLALWWDRSSPPFSVFGGFERAELRRHYPDVAKHFAPEKLALLDVEQMAA